MRIFNNYNYFKIQIIYKLAKIKKYKIWYLKNSEK